MISRLIRCSCRSNELFNLRRGEKILKSTMNSRSPRKPKITVSDFCVVRSVSLLFAPVAYDESSCDLFRDGIVIFRRTRELLLY